MDLAAPMHVPIHVPVRCQDWSSLSSSMVGPPSSEPAEPARAPDAPAIPHVSTRLATERVKQAAPQLGTRSCHEQDVLCNPLTMGGPASSEWLEPVSVPLAPAVPLVSTRLAAAPKKAEQLRGSRSCQEQEAPTRTATLGALSEVGACPMLGGNLDQEPPGPSSTKMATNLQRLIWLQLQCRQVESHHSQANASMVQTTPPDGGAAPGEGDIAGGGSAAASPTNDRPIQVNASTLAEAKDETPPSAWVGASSTPLSVGTIGHPDTCADACKYHWKRRGCRDGLACSHCHACSWQPQRSRRAAAQTQKGCQPREAPTSEANRLSAKCQAEKTTEQ